MAIKVVGHWEVGWDTPSQEYDKWIHPLREFGVENFTMIPVSGIFKDDVVEYRHIDDVFALPDSANYTRVYVDDKADVSLTDFVHPENAMYIFGRTSNDVILHKRPEDLGVKIPTLRNAGGFWAHQAMSILLYDRFLKGGI